MRANCKRQVTIDDGCVPVTALVIGMMDNNCFIVADGREQGAPAMVVDPAGDAEAIQKALGWFKLETIVCTHDHNDHLVALPELAAATGAKVISSNADSRIIEKGQPGYFGDWDAVAPVHVDRKVNDGDTIKLGSLEFRVMLTPGHTKGGICLYLPGFDGKPGVVFTGDTLFRGSCGRTDLPGGDTETELRSVKKLCMLPGDYEVYPGHMDSSTLERERRFNHYCREAMANF